MRTLATVMMLALGAVPAVGDVVFSEEFNAGNLGAFTYEDYRTDEPSVFEWTTNEIYGLGNFTDGTGGAAMSNSAQIQGKYDHAIVSPDIQLLNGPSSMSFLTNYQNFANIDFANVDISTNGGLGWSTLLSYNEDHGAFYSIPGETALIDLTAYAGQSIQIRFHHFDLTEEAFDWYWQVDHLVVESIPAPGALALMGACGLLAARRRRA